MWLISRILIPLPLSSLPINRPASSVVVGSQRTGNLCLACHSHKRPPWKMNDTVTQLTGPACPGPGSPLASSWPSFFTPWAPFSLLSSPAALPPLGICIALPSAGCFCLFFLLSSLESQSWLLFELSAEPENPILAPGPITHRGNQNLWMPSLPIDFNVHPGLRSWLKRKTHTTYHFFVEAEIWHKGTDLQSRSTHRQGEQTCGCQGAPFPPTTDTSDLLCFKKGTKRNINSGRFLINSILRQERKKLPQKFLHKGGFMFAQYYYSNFKC